MHGSKLFDRWLKKNVANVAEWCREHDFDPTYVCHLRRGRRAPSLRVACAIERATKVPVQAWEA